MDRVHIYAKEETQRERLYKKIKVATGSGLDELAAPSYKLDSQAHVTMKKTRFFIEC